MCDDSHGKYPLKNVQRFFSAYLFIPQKQFDQQINFEINLAPIEGFEPPPYTLEACRPVRLDHIGRMAPTVGIEPTLSSSVAKCIIQYATWVKKLFE
jgi:hypothetical protein